MTTHSDLKHRLVFAVPQGLCLDKVVETLTKIDVNHSAGEGFAGYRPFRVADFGCGSGTVTLECSEEDHSALRQAVLTYISSVCKY